MTRLCRCRYPIWQLTEDGRKPLRCTHCRRRAFKPRRARKAADRLLIWLAGHRVLAGVLRAVAVAVAVWLGFCAYAALAMIAARP